MIDPYELAEDRLVDELNRGDITEWEFQQEMALMRDELEAEAEAAADEAYAEVIGRW